MLTHYVYYYIQTSQSEDAKSTLRPSDKYSSISEFIRFWNRFLGKRMKISGYNLLARERNISQTKPPVLINDFATSSRFNDLKPSLFVGNLTLK